MEEITIWHNSRCSKSRDSLCYLQDKIENPTVFEYLKTPPTLEDVNHVLKKLNIPADALIRKGEEVYKSNFKDKKFSEDEWRHGSRCSIFHCWQSRGSMIWWNGAVQTGIPPQQIGV